MWHPNGGGELGADNASDDEDNGPEVALFAVHSDSDGSSVSDDDDIVAAWDEEEVFWTGYFTMRLTYLLSLQCTEQCPLIVVFLHSVAKYHHIWHV